MDERAMEPMTETTLIPAVAKNPVLLLITAAGFRSALMFALPGDELEYYRGDLATDRIKNHQLDELANVVLAICGSGKVTCVQRKHAEHDYSYLARVK